MLGRTTITSRDTIRVLLPVPLTQIRHRARLCRPWTISSSRASSPCVPFSPNSWLKNGKASLDHVHHHLYHQRARAVGVQACMARISRMFLIRLRLRLCLSKQSPFCIDAGGDSEPRRRTLWHIAIIIMVLSSRAMTLPVDATRIRAQAPLSPLLVQVRLPLVVRHRHRRLQQPSLIRTSRTPVNLCGVHPCGFGASLIPFLLRCPWLC